MTHDTEFCVSWVTSNQFYYAPCLTCWALFGSLVPAMCNSRSCAQVHELPWGHWQIANNQEGTLSVFLTTYIYIYVYIYNIYNIYITYIYNGIHHYIPPYIYKVHKWRILRSSYSKLAFEPTTTEFCSNANWLSYQGIRSTCTQSQLCIVTQISSFVNNSDLISAIAFISVYKNI